MKYDIFSRFILSRNMYCCMENIDIQQKVKLWGEKNLIEVLSNCGSNQIIVQNDIINEIKMSATGKQWNDTGKNG